MEKNLNGKYRVIATITGIKGHCAAGHKTGESFEISGYNSGGLCGFFYHNIYPNLLTFEYGGQLPWWNKDAINLQCPDPHNLLTLKFERYKI